MTKITYYNIMIWIHEHYSRFDSFARRRIAAGANQDMAFTRFRYLCTSEP